MKKIKIGSEGMGSWGSKIVDYLLKLIYPDIEILWENNEDCDIIVKSHFYNTERKWTNMKKPYIYWSGEPFVANLNNNHTKFINIHTCFEPNTLYIPFCIFHKGFDGEERLFQRKYINYDRKYLVAYCNSRKVYEREHLFNLLVQRTATGRCRSLGNCYGNYPQTNIVIGDGWHGDKLHIEYSKYNFVFAMENCVKPGYATEKIMNALYCGAIPIYWGANVIKEYINPDCFINVTDFGSFEECAEYIIGMSDEEIKWKMEQPIFKNNIIDDRLKIEWYKNPSQHYLSIANKLKDILGTT